MDVTALQDGKTLPEDGQWASVILTTNSLPNEVVAVAASFDKTLQYGAQTPFSDQLAFHWAGSEWQYDPLHDSIITVGNGGTKPTQAAFTILYNQGTQKYELDQTLQPGEQMWMDIGKLIRESIPDKSGKTLPADLTTGSYEIRDLNNHAIGALFEGKVIYDKTYGHVTYGCGLCCGYKKVQLWLDPLGVDFQGTSDNGVNGLNACGGDWEDTSDAFFGNWSSANTGIATVDYYGTHTGQGVGSTTSSTHGSFTGWRPGTVNCPVQGGSPGGGDNVPPTISLSTPLWFFGTGVPTPSGFTLGATGATLTANGAGNGTYIWTIAGGTSEAVFENNSSTITKTNTKTVGISSTSYSTAANDVNIQLQFTPSGGSTLTASLSLSIDSPYKLLSSGPITSQGLAYATCPSPQSGTAGYISYIPYNIISFFGVQITHIPINEVFGSRNDYWQGNNWPSPTAGSYTSPDGTFADQACQTLPSATPPSYPPGSPNSSLVFQIAQDWYVGSLTSGSGLIVQEDELEYYQSHGDHTGILSPVR